MTRLAAKLYSLNIKTRYFAAATSGSRSSAKQCRILDMQARQPAVPYSSRPGSLSLDAAASSAAAA